MRGNVFLAAVIVVAFVGLSAGGAYAAGRVTGERTGATKARQDTISELQAQFQQALATLQAPEQQGGSGTAPAQTPPATGPGALGRAAGGFLQGGALAGGRGATGRIEDVTGDRLTVTTLQGATVTVALTGETSVTKTVQGTREDLVPGTQVLVTGERQADGSIQAAQVTVVSGAR